MKTRKENFIKVNWEKNTFQFSQFIFKEKIKNSDIVFKLFLIEKTKQDEEIFH